MPIIDLVSAESEPAVYDEHAIIYSKPFHDAVNIEDKVEIIPVPASMVAARFAILPAFLRVYSSPSATTAMPAES